MTAALPAATELRRASPRAAAQHQADLWSDPRLQVFAVLMGRRVPQLPARLAEARPPEAECLLPGAPAPAVLEAAPQLVRLAPAAPFTAWLLGQAHADFPDWGVLLRSAAGLPALRQHLRGLLQAQLPGGQPIALDWMDPPVLRALLPGFAAPGLAAFFGPVHSFTVPGATLWWQAEAPLGRLQLRELPVHRPQRLPGA